MPHEIEVFYPYYTSLWSGAVQCHLPSGRGLFSHKGDIFSLTRVRSFALVMQESLERRVQHRVPSSEGLCFTRVKSLPSCVRVFVSLSLSLSALLGVEPPALEVFLRHRLATLVYSRSAKVEATEGGFHYITDTEAANNSITLCAFIHVMHIKSYPVTC